MAIREVRPGVWEVTVYSGLRSNGKQHRKFATVKGSERAALKKERDMKVLAEDDDPDDFCNLNIKAAFTRWMTLKINKIETHTYNDYLKFGERFVEYFGERKPTGKITEFQMREYIAFLETTLSATTVRKHFFILREFFNDVLSIGANPMHRIDPPKPKRYKAVVPTQEEFAIIHNEVRGTDKEPIILLAAWCGMRAGEIFALTPNHIDAEQNIIKVSSAISYNALTKKYDVKKPKSDNGIREIRCAEYLIKLLVKKIKTDGIFNRRIFDKEVPSVFSHKFGNIVNRLAEKVDDSGRVIQAAKIRPGMRFHDLRHFHATELFDAGFSDQYSAARLGHDVNTLKTIYQHMRVERKKKDDDAVVKLFGQ